MIRLNVARDANSSDRIPALRFSSHCNVLALLSGVADTITVPDGAKVALFSYPDAVEIWVKVNDPVAIPAANIVNGTAPELNPEARQVTPGDSLNLISAGKDANIMISFYS